MVNKAYERFQPKTEYHNELSGGGVRATMRILNPDGSVNRFSHIGPNSKAAKGMCAEEALSLVECSINYTMVCFHLCAVLPTV
jgi:hypothetical protein